jgi:hypothetical protein
MKILGRDEAGHRRPLSDEDAHEFHACSRKRRFPDKISARKAASQAARRKDAPKLFVYHCPYCGGWHLTHRRPKG